MGPSTKMTHSGRYVDGCGEREEEEEAKNNSSIEGWSQRLGMCHTCLLFLKIPPVKSGRWNDRCRYSEKDTKLEAALARFQKRCSRCVVRQGFQGHGSLFVTSSLKQMPYSLHQSATSQPVSQKHNTLELTIPSKVDGAARMFRLYFLLLSFLPVVLCVPGAGTLFVLFPVHPPCLAQSWS